MRGKRVRVEVTQEDVDRSEANRRERQARIDAVGPYIDFRCPGMYAIARTFGTTDGLTSVGFRSWTVYEADTFQNIVLGSVSQAFTRDVILAFDKGEPVRLGTYYLHIMEDNRP